MIPWIAVSYLSRRISTGIVVLATPALVTSAEWVHGQTDFSYPWLTIGYAAVDMPMGQLAEFVGVYGLSMLMMVMNSLVFWTLHRRAHQKSWQATAAAALIVFAVCTALGSAVQGLQRGPSTNREVGVSIVQPNINPWDKWSAPSEQLQIHKDITDSLRRSGSDADVIVWSETAIPYVIRNYRYLIDWIMVRNWVDTASTSLLTGFADMMVYPDGEAPASARSLTVSTSVRYDHFNAAMVLNPLRADVPVHRKTMLTPFAERLPFAEQLSFAMKWVEWGVGISAWGKGRERFPLPILRGGDTVARIGTIICIESIYPDVARDMVLNGADVLAVITNDAWYNGTWGPRQHYDIARMRAIEMRRPVIRCANSGVSGIIDAEGRSVMELPILRRVAATGTLRAASGLTVYARFGDVVLVVSSVLSFLLLLFARIPILLRILPATFSRQFSHTHSST